MRRRWDISNYYSWAETMTVPLGLASFLKGEDPAAEPGGFATARPRPRMRPSKSRRRPPFHSGRRAPLRSRKIISRAYLLFRGVSFRSCLLSCTCSGGEGGKLPFQPAIWPTTMPTRSPIKPVEKAITTEALIEILWPLASPLYVLF
jgi:hypothetical protein